MIHLESNKYNLIVADPPWKFVTRSEVRQTKAASNHYHVMPTTEIADMGEEVQRVSKKNCVLFLWTTAPCLQQAMHVIEAWGFAYKSNLVWRKVSVTGKQRMGTGFWARSLHEHVLIATKGSPPAMRLPSLFSGAVREHSRKPDDFYQMLDDRLEQMSLPYDINKLDMFSRQPRDGWDQFGDEADKFAA